MQTLTHKATKDGATQFMGNPDECWQYILKHQPHSVDHATTHEGWNIAPRRELWIVNTTTKEYIAVPNNAESFDGDWIERYPHCTEYLETQVYHCWDEQQTESGIYYVYDLVRDGGLFTLIYDADEATPAQIEAARKELKRDHDVVSLHQMGFTKVK